MSRRKARGDGHGNKVREERNGSNEVKEEESRWCKSREKKDAGIEGGV